MAVLIFITSAASESVWSLPIPNQKYWGGANDVGIEHVQWFPMRTQPLFLNNTVQQ